MKINELKELERFELIKIKGSTAYGIIHIKNRTIPYTYPVYNELTQEQIKYEVWNWARLALECKSIKKFSDAIDAREGAYTLAHYWHVSNTFLSMLFDAGVSCDEVIHMTNYWEKEVNKDVRKVTNIA